MTRADFYIGRGPNAEWLGSVSCDGYPGGHCAEQCKGATTEKEFRAMVAAMIAERPDSNTTPSQGWPWPWKTSLTTDFAFAFDAGKLWCARSDWWMDYAKACEPEDKALGDGTPTDYPDMTNKQNVTMGSRSGLIVINQP